MSDGKNGSLIPNGFLDIPTRLNLTSKTYEQSKVLNEIIGLGSSYKVMQDLIQELKQSGVTSITIFDDPQNAPVGSKKTFEFNKAANNPSELNDTVYTGPRTSHLAASYLFKPRRSGDRQDG